MPSRICTTLLSHSDIRVSYRALSGLPGVGAGVMAQRAAESQRSANKATMPKIYARRVPRTPLKTIGSCYQCTLSPSAGALACSRSIAFRILCHVSAPSARVSILGFRIPGEKRIQLDKLIFGPLYGLCRRVYGLRVISIFECLQFARFHQFSSMDQTHSLSPRPGDKITDKRHSAPLAAHAGGAVVTTGGGIDAGQYARDLAAAALSIEQRSDYGPRFRLRVEHVHGSEMESR
jgi:hypothetical protein